MLNKNFGKEIYTDLTILIATKDRLNQITQLLSSLAHSTKLPSTVIVVYNGVNIESEVDRFNDLFKLIIIIYPHFLIRVGFSFSFICLYL